MFCFARRAHVAFFAAAIIYGLAYLPATDVFPPKTKKSNYLELMLQPLKSISVIPFAHIHRVDTDWTAVTPWAYVYSAYIDDRLGEQGVLLRIVGALNASFPDAYDFQCIVRKTAYTASVEVILENHNQSFSAVFFVCKLGKSKYKRFRKITFIVRKSREPVKEVSLRIANSPVDSPSKYEGQIIICVRPFFHGRPAITEFAQFLAYYTVHGIRHFAFYHESTVSPHVEQFMSRLPKKYRFTYLPWSLDVRDVVWHRGQLGFLQDCLYRHMRRFEYVAVVDLDEFLFPFPSESGEPVSLSEFANTLPRDKTCFLFRHVCLPPSGNPGKLYIFESTTREAGIWEPKARSKYLARPVGLVEGWVHECRRFVKLQWGEYVVENALLFHYRNFTISGNLTKDTRMMVWKKHVEESDVMEVYRRYNTSTF
ncbi:beta-1,4-galactosyltransferase galt-1-like [Ornithodoros turicata]|uniref:beta-1,4-galactosyltransferase galt-1-like n=1 Tax=Ornithodoros turicata TaxID=34597 RepID=UPI0031399B57